MGVAISFYSGIGAKIGRVLMSHCGVDSYAECLEGLVVRLAELGDAYAIKGNDPNYEAVVEKRRCTAID